MTALHILAATVIRVTTITLLILVVQLISYRLMDGWWVFTWMNRVERKLRGAKNHD